MAEQQAPPETVLLTINGKQVEAKPGELVIDAAERNGTYIPRFCYHPRMEPVGMCRMCIVEIDTGRGPALQPSCMIPVAPDMVVDTESEVTKKAQEGVLEFLLINHPLDCPVCDKGGECPLQDQTLSHGPGESRWVEEKRHYEKPIPISELVHLDRERCILCDRCTRFAKDVAGDALIHFMGRGAQTQVNTFPDHPFADYFSGNTVQICPVGALLATPYRFKARPWDLDQVESTCTGCSVGCRIVVQSSRDRLVRYLGVDIDPVNWGWLCDKGRFSFEAVNSDERLGGPLVRQGDEPAPASWATALATAADALRGADPERVAVLGGARLTNESAYAWAKLAKGVLRTDNVDAQLGDGLPAEVVLGLPAATIDEVCAPGGTVLVIGPDVKEELPVLFLRLRHAVRRDKVTLVELTPRRTQISDLAAATLVHRPGAVGEVVAALLAGGGDREVGGIEPEVLRSAAQLLERGPVTVVLGRASVAESADATVAAALAIHDAHPQVRFLPVLRRGNVRGALEMGLAPGVLPGRVSLDDGRAWFEQAGWPALPAQRGLDATGILQAAAGGRLDVLVLLGADPLADFPDQDLATRALAGARTVIAVDRFLTASAAQADVVLAAAGFGEVDGTTTNVEGRISTVTRKVNAPGTARPDWMIAVDLAQRLGADLGADSAEAIWAEIERTAPSHAGITRERLMGLEGRDGIVAPLPASVEAPEAAADEGGAVDEAGDATDGTAPEGEAAPVAAEPAEARPAPVRPPTAVAVASPPLDAYALRLVATRRLYDHGTETQHAPSLAGLAAGTALALHPHDFDRLGIEPGGNVTVTAARGSLTVAAHPDGGVPRGSAAIVVGQGVPVGALIDATAAVTEIRVEPA